MPNLATNVVLGILSAGAVTTAIAVPVSLTATKGGAHQANPDTAPAVDVAKKEEAPKGFEKTNCYGSFLFEANKGELIFCEKQESKIANSSSLSFFYRVAKDQTNFFEPIEKLYISEEVDKWQVNFLAVKEDVLAAIKKSRSIKVAKVGQSNLNNIGLLNLQTICRKEIRGVNEHILKCVAPSYNSRTETYIIPVKKGEFAF